MNCFMHHVLHILEAAAESGSRAHVFQMDVVRLFQADSLAAHFTAKDAQHVRFSDEKVKSARGSQVA